MDLSKYNPCDLANDFILDTPSLQWLSNLRRDGLSRELGTTKLFLDNLDLLNCRTIGMDDYIGEDLENFKKTSLLIAQEVDVTTQKDSLVLFTGDNRTEAEKFVKQSVWYELIHSRPAGAMLEMLNLFDENLNLTRDERYAPWNILAKRLCQEASGNVTAVVRNPLPKPDSIFLNIELPELMKNEAVETINRCEKYAYSKKIRKLLPK